LIATAAAVLTLASVVAIALDVAPDATSAAAVSTATRAERTTAGPLELPTIGADGVWTPPEETTTENALSRPVPSRSAGTSTAPIQTPSVLTADPVAIPTPSETTPPPSPEPSVEPLPVAAETTVSESPTPTPTETSPAVVPTPTADPIPAVTDGVPNE
jgi:hypothetical protein